MAEQREEKEDSFDSQQKSDVEADDAKSAATEPDGFRNHEKIIAHQSNIGRLNSCVGARCAHRNANVGDSKGGCVVDTIADHSDAAEIGGEFPDLVDFLVRQEVDNLSRSRVAPASTGDQITACATRPETLTNVYRPPWASPMHESPKEVRSVPCCKKIFIFSKSKVTA